MVYLYRACRLFRNCVQYIATVASLTAPYKMSEVIFNNFIKTIRNVMMWNGQSILHLLDVLEETSLIYLNVVTYSFRKIGDCLLLLFKYVINISDLF